MKETIGDRLKQLRGSMPQPEFAKIAGTTKQYVWRLENGHNDRPNPDFIQAWAGHFGVRMEWITSGKPPKEAPVAAPSHPAGLDLDRIGLALTAIDQALSDMVIQGKLGTLAEVLEFAYRRALKIEDHTSPKERAKLDSEVARHLRGWVDGRGRAFEAGAGEDRAVAPPTAKAGRGKG